MKKILFTITILFLLSCSNDYETIEENLKTSNKSEINESSSFRNSNINEIKELAKDVYFDYDFNRYVEININFTKKIKIKNNLQELRSLNTEQELRNWVSNNISKTEFNTIEEFNNTINVLDFYKNIFLNKFENRFENFRNFSNFNTIFENAILKIATQENINIDSSGNCYTRANNCIRRARNNAAAGMAASIVTAYFNPIIGAAGGIASYIYLQNALEACQEALDACLGN
jgi:hypothetical protein